MEALLCMRSTSINSAAVDGLFLNSYQLYLFLFEDRQTLFAWTCINPTIYCTLSTSTHTMYSTHAHTVHVASIIYSTYIVSVISSRSVH